ncbi:putative Cytochrome p450 [Seiridium cardinale]|uniref:Cytochrome p450 n=1 Tax=Seiridium cardinale TaxID=138064 RepID=A0ABR2Y9F6_9PEZI
MPVDQASVLLTANDVAIIFFITLTLVAQKLAVFIASKPIYNVYFHPLRKFPGPKSWAATPIPYVSAFVGGNSQQKVLEFHRKYGKVVRLGRDELSFQTPEAWNEIIGHRKGQKENPKDPLHHGNAPHNIVSAGREFHATIRRVLSHGFSAQNVIKQQPLMMSSIRLFIQRLHEQTAGFSHEDSPPIEMTSWLNFVSFDVMGDLAFGETFGCLERSEYHPWIKLIHANAKRATYLLAAGRIPILVPALRVLFRKQLVQAEHDLNYFVRQRVDQRIRLSSARPDLAESLIKAMDRHIIDREAVYENSKVLLAAGSETTATALMGAVYLIAANPVARERLNTEIRAAFEAEEKININTTANLKYLGAVIEESLRLYPPSPHASTRITPPGGQAILGEWVPENTILGLWQWAIYHNDSLFHEPYEFRPERWLNDPAFQSDCKNVFKPFHTGPRSCLGVNLANALIRVILARIIWNFDLGLPPEGRDWLQRKDHKIFIGYTKPLLFLRLTPRQPARVE